MVRPHPLQAAQRREVVRFPAITGADEPHEIGAVLESRPRWRSGSPVGSFRTWALPAAVTPRGATARHCCGTTSRALRRALCAISTREPVRDELAAQASFPSVVARVGRLAPLKAPARGRLALADLSCRTYVLAVFLNAAATAPCGGSACPLYGCVNAIILIIIGAFYARKARRDWTAKFRCRSAANPLKACSISAVGGSTKLHVRYWILCHFAIMEGRFSSIETGFSAAVRESSGEVGSSSPSTSHEGDRLAASDALASIAA